MPAFVPGLELSAAFYHEAVAPILREHMPDLVYSAALIGYGSEVLGLDTEQSTDHHWGPRVLLFVRDDEPPARYDSVDQALRQHLPRLFRGYSTNFGRPDAIGVRLMQPIDAGPVDHMIDVLPLTRFLTSRLGYDPQQPLTTTAWLTMPQQRLREMTAGAVFYDGTGVLATIRERLAYYPHDVWLYLLAAQWQQIAQEEAFVGRAGDVGDELGSQIVAARLVRRLMQLCFLIERQYAPYSKWFGSAFKQLACAPILDPILRRILLATAWREREQHLTAAYEQVALLHNALGVTPPLDPHVSPYHARPYRVIHADRFVDALRAAIVNADVRGIKPIIGGVDQFVDSTDVLTHPPLLTKLDVLYV
jgi:hypothetical protein